jgi:TatA/E family protein of Tat protein translocase
MGFLELLLLSFLAFLLFGPKKTPELARKVGSAIGQFNRATNDLQTKLVSEATSILPQRGASIDTTFAAWTRSIVAAPPPAVGPLETAKECGDSKASTADAAAVTVEPSKTPEPQ